MFTHVLPSALRSHMMIAECGPFWPPRKNESSLGLLRLVTLYPSACIAASARRDASPTRIDSSCSPRDHAGAGCAHTGPAHHSSAPTTNDSHTRLDRIIGSPI